MQRIKRAPKPELSIYRPTDGPTHQLTDKQTRLWRCKDASLNCLDASQSVHTYFKKTKINIVQQLKPREGDKKARSYLNMYPCIAVRWSVCQSIGLSVSLSWICNEPIRMAIDGKFFYEIAWDKTKKTNRQRLIQADGQEESMKKWSANGWTDWQMSGLTVWRTDGRTLSQRRCILSYGLSFSKTFDFPFFTDVWRTYGVMNGLLWKKTWLFFHMKFFFHFFLFFFASSRESMPE